MFFVKFLKINVLFVAQFFLSVSQLAGMKQDFKELQKRSLQKMSVLQKYAYAKSEFLNLLDGHDVIDSSVPYRCFHDVLEIQGENAQELRAHAAYNLGLMCKAQLGVPVEEYGSAGARNYLLLAAANGHVRAHGELARSACQAGNYKEGIDWWRQERFFELSHNVLAPVAKIKKHEVCLQDQAIIDNAYGAIRMGALFSKEAKGKIQYQGTLQGMVKALKQCAAHGNFHATHLIARIQIMQADFCSPIDKKIELLKNSFERMKKAYSCKIASATDLMDCAMALGVAYKEKGMCDKAKESLNVAADLGHKGAKRILAYLILEDEKSSSQDVGKALALIEESALQGNIEDQRLLAALYKSDSKYKGSSVLIKQDLAKAYIFAKMLLASYPEDAKGRFIMGFLLGVYGGQGEIPANQQIKAYELLSSSIDHINNVSQVDYYVLGRLSFANGDYVSAMSWFDRAGNSLSCTCYRGLVMLVEAERGNKQYDKNKAFEFIEASLCAARKDLLVDKAGFSDLFCHELLIKTLMHDAAEGNLYARTILARIVYLFQDERLGISKEIAFSYLVQAAQAGIASAQSFLGFMYLHAHGVMRSDEKALEYFIQALKGTDVPNFIYDEIAQELEVLALEPVACPTSVLAAYYAIPAILHIVTPDSIKRAIFLLNKGEGRFINNFVNNKTLVSAIYCSGAWDALKFVADKGEGQALAALGLVLSLRFMHDIADFNTLKAEAFPLLEQAVCSGSTSLTSVDVSKNYMRCIGHALHMNLCTYAECKTFLDRAIEIDSPAQNALYTLASWYQQGLFVDVSHETSLVQCIAILKNLADGGHADAACDLGIFYSSDETEGSITSLLFEGIKYFNMAIKKGNRRALVAMVCAMAGKKSKGRERLLKEAYAKIDSLVANSGTPPQEKVFLLGLKAMSNCQYDKAYAYFDQVASSSFSELLADISAVLIYMKHDYKKAGDCLFKAIDLAFAQHIDMMQEDRAFTVRSILKELDRKSSGGDLKAKVFADAIRSKLQACNYLF